MGSATPLIIMGIVCYGFIVLPLSIASIVLGVTHPGSCDVTDVMGLNVGQYLLGLGIGSLVISFLLLMVFVTLACCPNEYGVAASIPMIVLIVLNALFGFAWFIVGAIILFRGNIDCIKAGSTHVIYALVLWCISAVQIITDCFKSRFHSQSNNA